jgi:hypothetical protein
MGILRPAKENHGLLKVRQQSVSTLDVGDYAQVQGRVDSCYYETRYDTEGENGNSETNLVPDRQWVFRTKG